MGLELRNIMAISSSNLALSYKQYLFVGPRSIEHIEHNYDLKGFMLVITIARWGYKTT